MFGGYWGIGNGVQVLKLVVFGYKLVLLMVQEGLGVKDVVYDGSGCSWGLFRGLGLRNCQFRVRV